MDGGRTKLRDRMLRDAIVEVLRGPFDPSDDGEAISLVGAGLIGHVAVNEDRVRVELPLPGEWLPFVGCLVAEVQRRVQALPEVTVIEIVTITGTDKQTNTANGKETDG